MIGATLAHCSVMAALGVGGMGEVWRAEDVVELLVSGRIVDVLARNPVR